MNTSLRFLSSLTCIIRECTLVPIENKPAFFPSFNFPAHFDEEPATGLLRDGHVVAGVDAVARSLHVAPQIEVLLPDRQIACQRSRLEKGKPMASVTNYTFVLGHRYVEAGEKKPEKLKL